MDIQTFQALPVTDVAQLVRAAGPKVCVFPINGTRRWFMLEHPMPEPEDYAAVYYRVAGERHLALYRLFFEHGVDTLLTPIFGMELLDRGEAYLKMATEGLALLVTHPAFLDFYQAYQVRVLFYGDYRRYLGSTAHADLPALFDEATARTRAHDRYRLFFGVCADDATGTIAELAVQYHTVHGRVPDKPSLVEMYYGERVEPVDLFIGFDKLCAFDMPLVATGEEDLYFTVSPSPYLSERQLRAILYDHLYTRRGEEDDYSALGAEERGWMRDFYRTNRDKTLGVGTKRSGIWYPLPQVELSPDRG
jgi:tuberculosinol/isotuberculosinol synthase